MKRLAIVLAALVLAPGAGARDKKNLCVVQTGPGKGKITIVPCKEEKRP